MVRWPEPRLEPSTSRSNAPMLQTFHLYCSQLNAAAFRFHPRWHVAINVCCAPLDPDLTSNAHSDGESCCRACASSGSGCPRGSNVLLKGAGPATRSKPFHQTSARHRSKPILFPSWPGRSGDTLPCPTVCASLWKATPPKCFVVPCCPALPARTGTLGAFVVARGQAYDSPDLLTS